MITDIISVVAFILFHAYVGLLLGLHHYIMNMIYDVSRLTADLAETVLIGRIQAAFTSELEIRFDI